MTSDYTTQYYARLCRGSSTSARAVVPEIMELVRPQSVIDLGCGTGAWLAEFERRGVADILGVDGPHVDPAGLQIDARNFQAADLTQPLRLDRHFDLALSLEVAEHLPEQDSCQLIETLTRLASVLLFSAAIPHQGGQHHVNEQWPDYWVQRFAARGFVAFDLFRSRLWERSDVDWWYAQNMVLFVNREHVPRYSKLNEQLRSDSVPALVHPRCFLQLAWRHRGLEAFLELVRATPVGARIVVVDENLLGDWPAFDRQLVQFAERDGVYNGPPRDSAEALGELQRQRESGAAFIAFAWPAFWWLEHYVDFANHLRSRGREILHTENWVVFALSDSPLPNEGN